MLAAVKKILAGGFLVDLFVPKNAKNCKTVGIIRADEDIEDLLEFL